MNIHVSLGSLQEHLRFLQKSFIKTQRREPCRHWQMRQLLFSQKHTEQTANFNTL